jgi:hypothetical protein
MVHEAAVDALGAVRTMISEQDDRAIVEILWGYAPVALDTLAAIVKRDLQLS